MNATLKNLTLAAVLVLTATSAAAWSNRQGPSIYAPDGTYLGQLNNNQFDPNSVSNPFGRYGSEFSPKSINNQFGRYGSEFSQQSPYGGFNPPPPRSSYRLNRLEW